MKMEEWKEYKLEDLCDELSDGLHKAPKFVENGEYIFVNAKNLSNGKIVDIDKQKHTTYEEYLKYKIDLNERTILYSIDGTIGNLAKYNNEKCVLGKGACYLNIKKDVSSDYIYYQLQTPHFKRYIHHLTTGSTIGHISLKTMRNYSFFLPPLPTQQKIAAILSSLDDKIELNNKINTNLEHQAQSLFKNWFVDFEPFGGKMPEGWKEKPLYDYADFINGTSFKEDEYGSEGLPIIKIAELKNGITEATQYFNGEKDSKYNVENEDILFSWSGNPDTSIDIFIWSLENGILNQHTFKVKSYTNNKWFTYCLLKYFKPEFCHRASCKQTTGLGHVTASDLKQITFSSSEKSESDFENLITPIMKQIFNNKLENQKLENIRDTLLPKLMNGEIEV